MLDAKWSRWGNIPDVVYPLVELWEACALSMNMDPEIMNFHPQGWMIGPGDHGPFFTDETFKNLEAKNEYYARFELLKANLNNKKFFAPAVEDANLTYLRKISIGELAAFALHCDWTIPEQLRALKPELLEPRTTSVRRGEASEEFLSTFDRSEEYIAAFSESVLNDKPIEWEFWVGRMPELSIAEAARLMAALDPHLYEDLGARPNSNDVNAACLVARKIERLAQAAHCGNMSPADWLGWAEKNGVMPCAGFRLAVDRVSAETPVSAPVTLARPEPKQRMQERALLEALRKLGFDPQKLPVIGAGKSGPKLLAWQQLEPSRQLFSRSSFDKAWDRLRASGEIANKG